MTASPQQTQIVECLLPGGPSASTAAMTGHVAADAKSSLMEIEASGLVLVFWILYLESQAHLTDLQR